MRNVTVLKVYNLVNDKGNKLHLRLGELKSRHDDVCISSADKGLRWSFVGSQIPMPVRSETWFNGFPEATMLDWLKGNGWYVQTCVNMCNGNAKVYDVHKGNKNPDGLSDALLQRSGENAVKYAVRMMWDNGSRIKACALYRYFKGCSTAEAAEAIKEIVDEHP